MLSLNDFPGSATLMDRLKGSTAVKDTPPSATSTSQTVTPPTTPSETTIAKDFAFAFDIDGVLMRGGKPIPEAIEAMKVLNGKNKYGVIVPHIFVTNGGGKSEEERCTSLSSSLETPISPAQFICGHTPMRDLASTHESVLVIGGEGEACRKIAQSYGFKDVITPGDIIKDNVHTTPFRTLTADEHSNSRARNFGAHEISAVLIFADSRDWAGDMQIILDLSTSINGKLGTRSETFDQGPPVYFAHNDIVWSTPHDHTRLGMGALRASLGAMFSALTGGKPFTSTAFGKPQIGTFVYAQKLLEQWRKDEYGIVSPSTLSTSTSTSATTPAPSSTAADSAHSSSVPTSCPSSPTPLKRVYFVGDTPESDIRGTNDYNEHIHSETTTKTKTKTTSKTETDDITEWYSILVRTGVYRTGTQPKYTPKITVDNVLEAVKFGVEREMEKKENFMVKT